MSKLPRHYAGRQFFAVSGLPFFAMRRPQSSHILHDHDFFEIVLVLDGKAEHQIYGTKYEISKGDILIIPVHQDHAYPNTENLEIVNALFDPVELEKAAFDLPKLAGYQRLFSESEAPRGKPRGIFAEPCEARSEASDRAKNATPSCGKPQGFLAKKGNSSLFPAKHKGRLNIPTAKFAAVVSLLTDFISEIEAKRPGYKAMAASLFIQAIGVIVRCHEHINTPPLLLSRIEQTLNFIEAHHNENISLDQMARLAHMSRSSYQRIFRKLMNTSPINYLVNLRIRQASSLLLCRPELNITEIAMRVGFSDSNYFSRMFGKITGHTPRDFRRFSNKTRYQKGLSNS